MGNLPGDIEKQQEKFAKEVNEARNPEINCEKVCIPQELVLNWDQTGSNLFSWCLYRNYTCQRRKQTGGYQGFR